MKNAIVVDAPLTHIYISSYLLHEFELLQGVGGMLGIEVDIVDMELSTYCLGHSLEEGRGLLAHVLVDENEWGLGKVFL